MRADLADSGCTEVVAAPAEMVVPAAASRYAVWLVKKRSAWRKKTAQNGRGFERRYQYRPERRTFFGFLKALLARAPCPGWYRSLGSHMFKGSGAKTSPKAAG